MQNKVLINNVMGEFAKCESNVKELINNSAPAQIYVKDGVKYEGYKAYVKGLKKDLKRVESLKAQAEAIKAAAIAEGDYENMEKLNVNIGNFQSKIDGLNIELGKGNTKKIVDGINADTYKGIIYEICKTFDGVFSIEDVYAYKEMLAEMYPNIDRNSVYGDNIENTIRGAMANLSKWDGVIERLGYNAYRVPVLGTPKGTIFETTG
jgi:hypothetical protein